MTKTLDKEALQAKFAEKHPKAAAVGAPEEGKAPVDLKGYPTYRFDSPEDLVSAIHWLKDEMGFAYLDMISAVDWKGPIDMDGFIREPNPNVFLPEGATPQVQKPIPNKTVDYRESIELVYLLSNLDAKLKVCLKVDIPRDGGKAPTAIGAFKSADWQERELYDLFGVEFVGHPNLSKILTPDFLKGHPLRKDYKHEKDHFDD
jgi:NADH:ubiquinone oxidoreductase subunit C